MKHMSSRCVMVLLITTNSQSKDKSTKYSTATDLIESFKAPSFVQYSAYCNLFHKLLSLTL
eukprot:3210924-Amphidinium_carterae.2